MNSIRHSSLENNIKTLHFFKHLIIENITMITEGLSNVCFKVSVKNPSKDYFVKYFEDKESFQKELSLSSILSNNLSKDEVLQITPNIIASDQRYNAIVYQFIVGHSLSKASLTAEDKAGICIKLMTTIHPIPASLPVLNIKVVIDSLLINLQGNGDFNELHNKVITLFYQQFLATLRVKKHYFCHGDMNFSNIMLASKEPNNNGISINKGLLIDFECACLADREFEIAMMIAINHLPINSIQSFIHQYNDYLQSNDELDSELVMRYLLFSFLINGLWYLSQKNTLSEAKAKYLAQQQFLVLHKLTNFDFSSLFSVLN